MNLPDVAVVALIGAIPSLATIVWAIRRFPYEQKGIEAEANQDNATAAKTNEEAFSLRVDGYEKVFRLLMSRDEEILRLNNKTGAFEFEINRLTGETSTLRKELEQERHNLMIEREKRVIAEQQRDTMAGELEGFRTAMVTQRQQFESDIARREEQIGEILQTVRRLQSEIDEMKTNPTTATGTYTLVPSTS